MRRKRICLNTEFRRNITDWTYGQQFLVALCSQPLLQPQKVSHDEPVNMPFHSIESCEELWAKPVQHRINGSLSDHVLDFQWYRSNKVRTSGAVSHSLKNFRGKTNPGYVQLDSDWSPDVDWFVLFDFTVRLFGSHLALLHVYTPIEMPQIERLRDFRIGGFGPALAPRIQEFGWAMALGEEFAKEVDFDRIAKADFPIERTERGFIFRVTENMTDVVDDFAGFDERRRELKSFFRPDFFAPEDDIGPWPVD